jgi:steroid delta-isomerase-like uncharacterized protein
MDNITVLRGLIQKVWNEKRIELITQYVAQDYTVHLDHGDRWEGKTLSHADYELRLQDSFVPFPNIHFDIRHFIADGDRVAITWIMTGTNTGPIAGMPATGRPIRTWGTTIYHFRDGKVCGHDQVFDRATVLRQLGVMAA